MLRYVPDYFKTQEICVDAITHDECMLKYVPDHLKTQEMCNYVFNKHPRLLEHVPDYFVTEEMLKNQNVQDLADAYRERRRRLKKEDWRKSSYRVAWHPDRFWEWCMPHDEKLEISQLWSSS